MLFQNFYKRSDIDNRRRHFIIGSIFLMAFVSIAFTITECSHQPTQADIENNISKSRLLLGLDRFCQEIPNPPAFKYKDKKIYGNSLTTSIAYGYESNLSFAEVRGFYADRLEKEGWTLEDLWDERSAVPRYLEYRRGERTVRVDEVADPNADYVLSCSIEIPYPYRELRKTD